jgi:RHS repeat-associated protein
MNGRVYDPLLGRFGSPDPMTESPLSSEGQNRYSYVGTAVAPPQVAEPCSACVRV